MSECNTCSEPIFEDEKCPNSEKPCGHHCNHSWTHDHCCWCGKECDCEENDTSNQ